jgi:hypothetical protein
METTSILESNTEGANSMGMSRDLFRRGDANSTRRRGDAEEERGEDERIERFLFLGFERGGSGDNAVSVRD